MFKKGLAVTRLLTKALMGLGVALLLGVWGDGQEASKPTPPSSNKTAGFPSGHEKQPPTPRQLVQASNACPEWGTLTLFKADVLQRCIDEGLNPNAKIEKETLLTTVAGMSGQDATEAVQVLLEAGADVNEQNGTSALMAASRAGHTATVQAVLDAGGNVNAQINDPGNPIVHGLGAHGLTALILASDVGHTATVQALLDAGADPNLQNKAGFTALMAASRAGHTATVQAVLAVGADLNLQSKAGFTALMGASRAGHTATVQALLDAGADVNVQINDQNWKGQGWTALMLASAMGHTATVRALLDAGADPDLRDKRGATASDVAGGRDRTEIVRIIEKAAAFR